MIFNFSTTSCPLPASSLRTFPVFPRSRPVMTMTVSPFRIRDFLSICPPIRPFSDSLQDFGSQRDDLHEFFPPQFPGDGPKDTSTDRLSLSIDQNAGVAVELDVGSIFTPNALRGPDDDRLADIALFDRGLRDGFFHGYHDDVSQRSIPPL